jgi:hypothetical protein
MISRRQALIAGGAATAVIGGSAVAIGGANRDKPEPPAPPSTDGKGHSVWRNWSGIQHSYPVQRSAPKDEGELATLLKGGPAPIRVTGAGHSFTGLCATDGTLVSLDAMKRRSKAGRATRPPSGPGRGWATLGPGAGGQGAGDGQPAGHQQAVAGRRAGHGDPRDRVRTLKAIHGDVHGPDAGHGRRRRCWTATRRRRPELFSAARVSLGALGIISQGAAGTTTANRRLRRRVWVEPFEEAMATGRGALGDAPELRVLRGALHRPGGQHHPRRDG